VGRDCMLECCNQHAAHIQARVTDVSHCRCAAHIALELHALFWALDRDERSF